LTNRYQVTSYHLIPRALGDEAIKWLQQRAAMLRPKLRRANPSAWRDEYYKAIWARARELRMSKGDVYSLVKRRLNLQVVSLKQLGEHNLRHLYNIVMSLDGKPDQ
jgi:site-specific recombinase XerD